jgi:DNA-binding NarL/FixJ family response regulator
LQRSAGTIDEANLQTVAARLLARGICGDDALLVTLGQRSDQVDAVQAVTFDATEVLLVVGSAFLACEAVEESHRVLSRAVHGARQLGAIGALPFRVGRLAWAQCWRGEWALAYASADEALTLATDAGWHGERTNALLALARIEGLMGQRLNSRAHAEEARELALATGSRSYQAMAEAVLGSVALSVEEYAEAVEHFARVQAFADAEGVVDNPMLWWSAEHIESLVRCDREDEARTRLEGFAARPASSTRPVTAAVVSRCEALLDPSCAQSHLREALRLHSKGQMPFEQARTELQLGRYLRRQRRPEARELLHAAAATFERLGALDWAERARVELRAAGVRMAPPAAGMELLTPQELQVALAVGRGLTNREVAAHLFLSVKTVEYHLSKTYAKLGLTNRTQLVGVVDRLSPDWLAAQGSA